MFDVSTVLVVVGTFLIAGVVKGVIGLGLPTVSLALLTVAGNIMDESSAVARPPYEEGGEPDHQQPAMHLPLPSNSIVLPLKGIWTGIPLIRLANAAVLDPGTSLPPLVASSLV